MRAISISIICLLFSATIFAQSSDSSLEIYHLTGNFYVYKTFNLYKGHRIPANGMYLVTSKGAVLFDCPWDTTQFQPLLDSIKLKHHTEVAMCIATHFHSDRSAGLEYYRRKGIKTFTTKKTDELSLINGMKRAEFLIDKDTVFTLGTYTFETYYAGPGHTADNIVIWFNKEKILYGGCLIKSTEDADLGFLGDANVKEYANTIKNVQQKCKNPLFVIPGHDDWTDTKSLEHTYQMAAQLAKKNKP